MTARRLACLLLAALLLAGVWAGAGLRLGSDLARFMPAPANPDQRLVRDELGGGPASRILLLAIRARDDVGAAGLSRELAARLREDPAFTQVLNGETGELAQLQSVLPLRFSHSPGMDSARFDAAGLAEVLRDRLADLGAFAGEAFDTLLAHDPHLLTLALADSWRPLREPALRQGVWFGSDGRALLLVQTRAAGFDPSAQAQVIARVREVFATLATPQEASLLVTGAGSFSARMGDRVAGEAAWLGGAAGVVLVMLLVCAYRSVPAALAAAVPVLCAIAAGLVALRLAFDEVHGITLAFAFTLIGVAQDYPVHLLSHLHPATTARAVARSLWPALRLGVGTTVIAYASLFSGCSEGLAQLAVFTITGLLAAALASRWLLPELLPAPRRDVDEAAGLRRLAARLQGLRAGTGMRVAMCIPVTVALLLTGAKPWWNNDLASLTPLPRSWLEEEARLRAELAGPDARHVLLLAAADREELLRLSERLAPRFEALVQQGALADHALPSRYEPSRQTQAARLARLPPTRTLRADLRAAADSIGFDAEFFEPMLRDVEVARAPDALEAVARAQAASPAGDRIAALLREGEGQVYALVPLSGLVDAQAVAASIAGHPGARLLDLKQVAEDMVAGYRTRVLQGLGFAAVLLLALLGLALRRQVLRVLPPVLLGLAATVAILRLAGLELTLFHLVALMLATGLGMDYALFFNHAGGGADWRRTLHAVLLSAASTVLVFGLLACSAIPVLRAIGGTVAIGVATQFLLALGMASRPSTGGSHV